MTNNEKHSLQNNTINTPIQNEEIKKKKKDKKVKKKKKREKKRNNNEHLKTVKIASTFIDDNDKSLNDEKHVTKIFEKEEKALEYEFKQNKTINDFIKNSIEQKIPNVSRDMSTKLCVAIPSTIINHKSDVVKAYIISYLARVFTIFSVHKIYIYDDQSWYENTSTERNENNKNWNNEKSRGVKNNIDRNLKNGYNEENDNKKKTYNNNNNNNNNNNKYSYLCRFMNYNLQYLETPQYLRKHLFPITPFLKNSGIMNPVDAPHHLRRDEWLPFREGVIIEKKGNGLIVDVGLFSNVFVKTESKETSNNNLSVGTRVTILFDENAYNIFEQKNNKKNISLNGKLISPKIPLMYNVYWGYTVEVIKTVSDIFNFKFDYIIGTSERGKCIDNTSIFEKGKSILIVFGNRDGLEDLLIREKEAKKKRLFTIEEKRVALSKILKKFDFFINTCLFQTSRTIRTEEALTITLSLIHNMLK